MPKERGVNNEGYMNKGYYIERIRQMAGIPRLKKSTKNMFYRLSNKQLKEIIYLLECAYLRGLDVQEGRR